MLICVGKRERLCSSLKVVLLFLNLKAIGPMSADVSLETGHTQYSLVMNTLLSTHTHTHTCTHPRTHTPCSVRMVLFDMPTYSNSTNVLLNTELHRGCASKGGFVGARVLSV